MTSPFWSPLLAALEPYVPGEQPAGADLVKLNTNENPYPPSPRVLEAIRAAADERLRLYPPPESDALREALGRHFGLGPEWVFVGNGSDEVLAHCFFGFFGRGGTICFPDVTYSFYPVWCRLYGIPYREVPLREDFTLALEDYPPEAAGVIFPNPNAPTGRALPREAIAAFLARAPQCFTVVDEAYVDFGAESAVPLVRAHPNLLVVGTFSKSRSLAGLRVGYAVGQPALIEGLVRLKNSFNSYPLDRLAIAGAVAALADGGYFEETRARVVAARAELAAALERRGFEVVPSAANFLFCRHPCHTGAYLEAGLRGRGIVVRRFARPRIADYLRITVGTPEQHRRLLAALDELL
ncbi:MAG: histidinol-phosphate aminotransferase [Porticoccaceae bacterium]|nr:MAG: histidinol-phosphate aminotransferase [Porticoccaceae bacterium]